MAKGDKINICVLQGSEGKSLYVNDYRVSGSKPWEEVKLFLKQM